MKSQVIFINFFKKLLFKILVLMTLLEKEIAMRSGGDMAWSSAAPGWA